MDGDSGAHVIVCQSPMALLWFGWRALEAIYLDVSSVLEFISISFHSGTLFGVNCLQ